MSEATVVAIPRVPDEVVNALGSMCEAANEAHPVRSFVISADDLYHVAAFIHGLLTYEQRKESVQ